MIAWWWRFAFSYRSNQSYAWIAFTTLDRLLWSKNYQFFSTLIFIKWHWSAFLGESPLTILGRESSLWSPEGWTLKAPLTYPESCCLWPSLLREKRLANDYWFSALGLANPIWLDLEMWEAWPEMNFLLSPCRKGPNPDILLLLRFMHEFFMPFFLKVVYTQRRKVRLKSASV